MLYAGIDVSSKNNVVCLMKPDGSKHEQFTVPNNIGGAQIIAEKIISALNFLKLRNVSIGIEATSVYGENLMLFLREHADLRCFECKFYVLNPKQVKKFKDAYNDLPKTDLVDSFVIADNLRFGRTVKQIYQNDYKFKALQNLTRARFAAVQNVTREKQRFANYIFLKFSGLAQDKIFSDNSGATSVALLESFDSADDLANISLEDLGDFIAKSGRNHFADPNAVAQAVQVAVRGSYRLPKTVNDSVNQLLAVSVATLKALKESVKTLDKAVEKQLELIPNTLISIKGFGLVYTAGIIAEIGDIARFDSHAALAKYAGLAWSKHQSGNFDSDNTHLIKSGNRFLRYYLLEAANSLRKCDPEFTRYYDLKFKEVNKFQHKRALALTARKLVRLIFRLLKDNRLYTPPKI